MGQDSGEFVEEGVDVVLVQMASIGGTTGILLVMRHGYAPGAHEKAQLEELGRPTG